MCGELPYAAGTARRAAARARGLWGGVIVSLLFAMVDGESKAGGSGSRGFRPCRDGAAPGTAGWPEPCSAFYGQRVRLSRGAAVRAVSQHPEARVQRAETPRTGGAGEPRVPTGVGATRVRSVTATRARTDLRFGMVLHSLAALEAELVMIKVIPV